MSLESKEKQKTSFLKKSNGERSPSHFFDSIFAQVDTRKRSRRPSLCNRATWLYVTITFLLFACFCEPVLCNKLRRHRQYDSDGGDEDKYSDRENSVHATGHVANSNSFFEPGQNEHEYVEWGKNAYLHCVLADKRARVKIAWSRISNGFQVLAIGNQSHNEAKYTPSQDGKNENDYRLIIKNTNLEDSGVYQCEIEGHKAPSPRRTVRLTITANEGSINGTTKVIAGSHITIACHVKVIPPNKQLPTVLEWYHNDTKMKLGNTERAQHLILKNDSSSLAALIEINHATVDDTGTYKCRPFPDMLGGRFPALYVDVHEHTFSNRVAVRNTAVQLKAPGTSNTEKATPSLILTVSALFITLTLGSRKGKSRT